MPIGFQNYQVDQQILSEQELRDIFETLYRGDVREIVAVIIIDRLPKSTRGLHAYVPPNMHTLTLDFQKIRSDFDSGFKSCGGNLPAPSLRMAVGLVMAHETEHANQTLSHTNAEKFYRSRRYRARGCERDARIFADNNRRVLAEILSEELPDERKIGVVVSSDRVVSDVLEAFLGNEAATVDEVVEVLRNLEANNPKNLNRCLEMLRESGMEIK